MPFEPQNIPPNFFNGQINAFAVLDPAGLQPTTIIRTTDTWHVSISWVIAGIVADALAGAWQVSAFLESMGTGFEGQVGVTLNINLAVDPSTPRNYNALITVPPGTPAGAYKLVTTVTYLTPANQPGFMAGYEEGPILQFFNP
ncbi:MAG: hypothetical protein L0Z53_12085 [Acidobacteriales bacterium]|nr:hypothetical protein [Terriglobales bacterium]